MNITSYAYPNVVIPAPDEGTDYLDVEITKTDDRIVILFKDGGVPFNPLERKKPDISQSWKLRPIGGLGIYLVTKKMDAIHYAYEDNKNVLTIEKGIMKNEK